jgi:hypothetical protein
MAADLRGDLLGAEADLKGRPEGLHYGDEPEGLHYGDGPEGLRYGDGPEGQRYGGGPRGQDTGGAAGSLHYGDGPDGLSPGDLRWLSPLSLWTGILAGPIAWALDLSISYAIVKWTCSSQRQTVLHAISPAALLMIAIGAFASFMALRHTAGDHPTDGADPRQRARFMAILGLTSCALFGLTVIAGAIPRWVLDACQ